MTGRLSPRHPGCMVDNSQCRWARPCICEGRCRLRSRQGVIKKPERASWCAGKQRRCPWMEAGDKGCELRWRVVVKRCVSWVTCFSLDKVSILFYAHASLWRELDQCHVLQTPLHRRCRLILGLIMMPMMKSHHQKWRMHIWECIALHAKQIRFGNTILQTWPVFKLYLYCIWK